MLGGDKRSDRWVLKPGLTSPTGGFRSDTSGGGTALHPLLKLPSSWALSLRRRQPALDCDSQKSWRLRRVLTPVFPVASEAAEILGALGRGPCTLCGGERGLPWTSFNLGGRTEGHAPRPDLAGLVTPRAHGGRRVARSAHFLGSGGRSVRSGMLTVASGYCASRPRHLPSRAGANSRSSTA